MTGSQWFPPVPGTGQLSGSQSPPPRRGGEPLRQHAARSDWFPTGTSHETDPTCIHCGSRYLEQGRCLDCGRTQR